MPKTKKKAKSATRPSDYFPDIDQWPNDWMGTKEDLQIGRGLLALFIPFVQHLIDEGLAKKTIKNHGSHLGILGSEIIRRLNGLDEENRTLSPRELILHRSCTMSTTKVARCSLFGVPMIKLSWLIIWRMTQPVANS